MQEVAAIPVDLPLSVAKIGGTLHLTSRIFGAERRDPTKKEGRRHYRRLMHPRNNMKKRQHREFGVGTRVVVNEMAPGGYVGRLGTVLEIVLTSRYGIRFDDQHEPTVYLDAESLDPAPRVRTT